jgi:hypothetical protein
VAIPEPPDLSIEIPDQRATDSLHRAEGRRQSMASKKASKKLARGKKIQPKKALTKATYNVGTAVAT